MNSENIKASVSEYLAKHNIHMEVEYLGEKVDNEGWAHYAYTVTFNSIGREAFSIPFNQGLAHTEEPSPTDVIYCLTLDLMSDEPFEEWASNLGYNTDSRKAEAIYHKVKAQNKLVRAFFSEQELADLTELTREY